MRRTTYLQGQVGPPEPNLAVNLISPTNGEKDPRTQIDQETHIGHFQTLAWEINRGHQIKLSKFSPSLRGKTSLHQCTPYHGFRAGAYMV
ncbi:hypothetical protein O181_072872 [Austropuccinia psidii MF-1]|uniref:Uncharacterized protein n=1 Tax=Austropuccinia psidii MF-1 TaxID=1389203 RepID=A0A9Q3IAI6_9BASI|nr:hypothetical protein [Austropuccinia psidii MF-1]